MNTTFALLLFFLAHFSFCAWTTPLKLTPLDRECSFPQMYIDPATHITHAIWVDNIGLEFRLAYTKVFPNQTFTEPFFIETKLRPRLSNIIGEGDGKHLLLSYDAKRGQGDDHDCTEKDTLGCYEIYFTESFDGGNTWSKPVMISRDKLEDAKDRKGPRIIYVKETSQTYITYWCSGPMAYTIRYGKGAFSKETIMPFGNMTAYQSIMHTVDQRTKKVKLHFIYVNWSYPLEHMMYTSSLDDGKTWRTPRLLVTNVHKSTLDSYFRPYAVANSEIYPDGIFVSFILDNEAMLMWSKDDGNTWSKVTPTRKGGAIAPRIQLCKGSKNKLPKLHLLFALRRPESGNSFIFGTLDVDTGMYKDGELPFKRMTFNWAYVVDCYIDSNDNEVSGAIVESFDEELNSIFVTYNNDLKAVTNADA